MGKTLKDHSKVAWSFGGDEFPGYEKVKIGCLQRIADAAEAMAQNYLRLQSDLEYYKRRCKGLEQDVQTLKNSRAGYMAALTKEKKKRNA